MQTDSKKALILGIVAMSLIAVFFVAKNSSNPPVEDSGVVSIENETQIIDLTAKGGYSPSRIEAQAGVPTTLRVTTNGTYDCSSALVIPELDYQTYLAPTGVELIQLSADQAQGTLKGMCSMGMFGFEIAFN